MSVKIGRKRLRVAAGYGGSLMSEHKMCYDIRQICKSKKWCESTQVDSTILCVHQCYL